MPVSVVMPALELAQETGKLLAWRKKEGEQVTKGEPLLEVETDKAVVEIEAPADGILAGIKAYAGAVVPVGQTIAWIVGPGEVPPPEGALPAETGRAAVGVVGEAPAAPRGRHDEAVPQTRISPKARRLARERGVDVARLRGSGPGGEILAADVLASAASSGGAAPAEIETVGRVGRLMAERTTRSWTTVPHFFVSREVDAGALVGAREQLGLATQQAHGVRPTHTDFLIGLVARVLGQHPRLNASWTEEGIRLHQEVNIGVAVAVSDGVTAVVIHNANTASLAQIAVQRRDLTERARAGRLRPSEVGGATFTLSNLGMYRVDAFSAIINPPQAAILAVGRIAERVVPIDGRPGIRPMMTLTLSCDHRVVDGARAAAFLNDLAEAALEPQRWLR